MTPHTSPVDQSGLLVVEECIITRHVAVNRVIVSNPIAFLFLTIASLSRFSVLVSLENFPFVAFGRLESSSSNKYSPQPSV